MEDNIYSEPIDAVSKLIIHVNILYKIDHIALLYQKVEKLMFYINN